MSAELQMTFHPAEVRQAAPRLRARTAGFFWLMTILSGIFALLVRGRLVVAAEFIAVASYIVATLLVYVLLKPVNRDVSLLAALFSLMGSASGFVSFAFRLLLEGVQHMNVFTVEQAHALSLTFLRLRAQAGSIGFLFFGLHCLLVGYLILKSTFLPRIVGALMVCAGLGWLAMGSANLLSAPLARALFPYILAPGILGEVSLALWLLVAGVNIQRWNEQASAGLSTVEH